MVTLEEQYISLQDASKNCAYSQEYLSLRARQGKLRALKVKRNWVTTKEWLQEYIARSEEFKQQAKRSIMKETAPPLTLPTEDMIRVQEALANPEMSLPRLAFISLVPMLLLAGLAIGQKQGMLSEFATNFDAGILLYANRASVAYAHASAAVSEVSYAFAEDFDSGFPLAVKKVQGSIDHFGQGINYGIDSPASITQAYTDINGVVEKYVKKDLVTLQRGLQRLISYFNL
ncbi:MAG: hypothetical protein HYT50_01540 [Candidatus Wildermuthbacteria bacterium]|nr:hypothetical protein [Candidatus Wildermuthbacteria bacterium]